MTCHGLRTHRRAPNGRPVLILREGSRPPGSPGRSAGRVCVFLSPRVAGGCKLTYTRMCAPRRTRGGGGGQRERGWDTAPTPGQEVGGSRQEVGVDPEASESRSLGPSCLDKVSVVPQHEKQDTDENAGLT